MIGLLCLLGGVASGFVYTAISGPPLDQSAALGRGAAQLLFCIAGIVLIVLHFVRGKA